MEQLTSMKSSLKYAYFLQITTKCKCMNSYTVIKKTWLLVLLKYEDSWEHPFVQTKAVLCCWCHLFSRPASIVSEQWRKREKIWWSSCPSNPYWTVWYSASVKQSEGCSCWRSQSSKITNEKHWVFLSNSFLFITPDLCQNSFFLPV